MYDTLLNSIILALAFYGAGMLLACIVFSAWLTFTLEDRKAAPLMALVLASIWMVTIPALFMLMAVQAGGNVVHNV